MFNGRCGLHVAWKNPIWVNTHTHTHTRMHAHMDAHTHAGTHAHTHTHTHTHVTYVPSSDQYLRVVSFTTKDNLSIFLPPRYHRNFCICQFVCTTKRFPGNFASRFGLFNCFLPERRQSALFQITRQRRGNCFD